MKNSQTTTNSLEVGQMAFGNPVGEYECPRYVDALFAEIFREISRIYWNLHQKQYEEYTDPEIDGVIVNQYYWGNEDEEAEKPNFSWGGVELRWYKYYGRSMAVNVAMDEAEWIGWFNKCIEYLQEYERDNSNNPW